MVHANADNGQSEGDVHAFGRLHLTGFLIPLETTHFERDVSLIMIHGHTSVELAASGLCKYGIGWHGALHIPSPLAHFLHGGYDFLFFLPAEETIL